MCFRTPTKQVYKYLPPPRDEIETSLCYIHMGPTYPDKSMLAKVPMLVRRNKVKRALNWLKLKHAEYADVLISDTNLDTYRENEIPVRVVY